MWIQRWSVVHFKNESISAKSEEKQDWVKCIKGSLAKTSGCKYSSCGLLKKQSMAGNLSMSCNISIAYIAEMVALSMHFLG
uniref:PH domain-containing protein n=1 Tax=Romanomermis culicivorax TaxID=13658 RepID=A0A915HGP4_ROMCU